MQGSLAHRYDVVDLAALIARNDEFGWRTVIDSIELLGIAENEVYFGHACEDGRFGLGGAACHEKTNAGPVALRATDCLTRLPYRFRRDRARVEDHRAVRDADRLRANHLGF